MKRPDTLTERVAALEKAVGAVERRLDDIDRHEDERMGEIFGDGPCIPALGDEAAWGETLIAGATDHPGRVVVDDFAVPAIPPIPEHPRFKADWRDHQRGTRGPAFVCEDCTVHCIESLDEDDKALESCCAIARCWFMDKHTSCDGAFGSGAWHEISDLWRAYYEARRGAK